MQAIICATRGGEGSRVAQMAAIREARQTGQPLIFLYVIDPATLGDVDDVLLPALHAELNWMGRTLLQVARQRAEAAGLLVRIVIREGQVRAEIDRFLQEANAALLILGAPRHSSSTVFGDDAVEQFAQAIQNTSGVRVRVIHPELLERRSSE